MRLQTSEDTAANGRRSCPPHFPQGSFRGFKNAGADTFVSFVFFVFSWLLRLVGFPGSQIFCAGEAG
jgi:hypothetical protein